MQAMRQIDADAILDWQNALRTFMMVMQTVEDPEERGVLALEIIEGAKPPKDDELRNRYTTLCVNVERFLGAPDKNPTLTVGFLIGEANRLLALANPL